MHKLILTMMFFFVVGGCGIIRKSPKTEFTDGYYNEKIKSKVGQVYVDIEDEEIRIHPIKMKNKKPLIDTAMGYQPYPKETTEINKPAADFSKRTMDIDFLTMPLKFRPRQGTIPPQLNANINGAVYVGWRTDKYNISYSTTPLGKRERIINHYGFSFGVFTGIGNTAMTPTTTNDFLPTEYDGIVWTKGVAGIIALNNFTLGVAIGFDNLFDKNRRYWIYESKPWFGLAFGLNLN